MNHTIRDSTIDVKEPGKPETSGETPEKETSAKTHFLGIMSSKPHFESFGPKWKKPCPPSHILFGTDGLGQVCIIEHEGRDANYLMQDSREAFIEEELATWKFPGLWVWVGKVRHTRSYEGECDEVYVGEVRPLTDDERQAIRKNDELWDPAIWREPDEPKGWAIVPSNDGETTSSHRVDDPQSAQEVADLINAGYPEKAGVFGIPNGAKAQVVTNPQTKSVVVRIDYDEGGNHHETTIAWEGGRR